eukprot:scaffold48939_cov56-Cyclotella_meneghiniana.AAC.2
MAFHDLTPDKSAPKNCKELFGLGSKFIPTPNKTTGKQLLGQTRSRFDRDFRLKVHFAGECSSSDDEADHKSKLYVKSKWTPSDQQTPSWVLTRVTRFFRKLEEIFKRENATYNLNPLQQELLDSLPSDPTYLFPEADKGLGPCAVKFIQYIEDVLVHLCNEEIYERLTEEEALLHTDVLHAEIIDWLNNYENLIGKHAYTFIKDHANANLESPLLYKIHKGINDDGKWPTRPTEPALASISDYIRNNTNMGDTKKEALIEAMKIVFRNNLFKFGDTYWRQKS